MWGVSAAQSQIRQNAELRDEVRELSLQNTLLQSRLTDSELIIDTQNHTSIALRDELTQLHTTNAGLETELGFFRKIMVPGETDQGIHVERMNVAAAAESIFVIEATLIQVAERPSVVSGSITLEIEGTRNGEAVRLTTTELGGSPAALDFRFRYFQALEQTVELPTEFTPNRIKVAVIGKKGTPVEAEFVWPA
ncbi:MAG: hypothetical protein EVA66_02650 [OM182 bacterium]|nr:MAG: hypothetical protein EVA66_02650 [OM182 bacterium]